MPVTGRRCRRENGTQRSAAPRRGLWASVALVLLAAGGTAWPQEYLVRTYAVAEGVPSPDVCGLAQDAAGRMWFATGAGVVCYDGTAWERQESPLPLPVRDYPVLRRDRGGTIWAVSFRASPAVASFDGRAWSLSSGPLGVTPGQTAVTAFGVGGSGEDAVLAVGTADDGLYLRRGGEWRRYGTDEGLPSPAVRDVAPWGEELYVATAGGLARVSAAGVDASLTALLPPDRRWIGAVALAGEDRGDGGDPEAILVLTDRSLELIRGGAVSTLVDGVDIRQDPDAPSGGVVLDGDGVVYFGGPNALYRLDLGRKDLRLLGSREGLVGDGVNAMLLDRQGNLWVAGRRGISKVVSMRFATFRARHGLLEDEVSAVCELRSGVMAFGHNRGLTVLDRRSCRSIPFRGRAIESSPTARVLDLQPDGNGGAWVAASELGLGRLSPSGELRWYGRPEAQTSVTSVAVDGAGVVWVGTTSGLRRLDGGRLRGAGVAGLEGAAVRRITVGREGNLLVATMDRGLLELDRTAAVRPLGFEGEPEGGVYAVALDRKGRTWVGTAVGLLERVGDGLARPPEPALDLRSPVYFVVEDGQGDLWFGTNNGVVRWDGGAARRYTPREGLAGWETNRAAGVVDRDGKVWIGTATGVSLYQRECDRPAAPPPLVEVTSLVVGDRAFEPATTLDLQYHDSSVVFRYRAVSFVDEDAVRVSYRLEGLDTEWTTPVPDQRHEARYAKLPPGRYRFQVRAANADGVWSETAESGEVTVAGPLWGRWWFVALLTGLAVVLFVACLAVVERWRWASRLESEVAERTEELRESEERYRRLFSDVALAKLLLDPASRTILDANPSAVELIGRRRDVLVGRRVDEVGEGWLVEGVQRLLHPPAGEPPGQVEVTAELSGGVRVVEAMANPIVIEGRGHLLVNLRDVTERRRLQEERLRSSKLESLGLLAGGLAHDFNNILTAVMGNLSLAEVKLAAGGDPAAHFSAAEAALERAKGLTSQLLAFAKGGAPVRRTANLEELIRETCSFVLAGSRSRVEVVIEQGLWPAAVDPDQLSQVLANLVVNASQAMESGGAITVRADNLAMGQEGPESLSPGPYVRISVADTGIGIPQEDLSRVFDPYFTTKPTGSGLGLAVSYAIVRRHGGDITLASLPGRGTVVSVLVPASPGATVDAAVVRPRSPVGKGRVLVMDDLLELRQLYRNALTTLGYEPEAASDGEEAVRLYREALAGGRPFACVIMDLTVPGGMGGTAALAELKRVDPHVRAIVASGYSNDPALADFRAAGFAGRLAKPFTISEMGRVVEAVLGRRGDG